ncbi:MAG: type II secretion system F family protein [Planctomycetota bacterium]|nr:type II secretion system F family protein [Planctomycetota bacterium]
MLVKPAKQKSDAALIGGSIKAVVKEAKSEGPALVDERLKLRPKESLNLLIQLRAMLAAGVPMMAALRCLIEHATTAPSERVLVRISEIVESGHQLSYAVDCLPRCFEKYVVHLLSAGEQAGNLDEALDRSIELLDNQIKLGGKIKGALAYPGFLLAMTGIMTTGILMFLVPKFENLLMKKPHLLPWSTKLVLGASHVLRKSPELVGFGAVAFIVAMVFLVKSKKSRGFLFDAVSHTPVIGTFIYKAYLSRSVSTLALTLESGVPILTGLEHARQVAQLPRLQRVWESAGEVVRDGRPLYTAFQGQDLPPAMIQMVVAGESSGTLDESLRRTAGFLERETQAALNTFTSLLGPATVVFAGAVVGFIVVALMTPILTMAKFVA